MRFIAADLSRLPPPDAIEALDYEQVLAAMKADVRARWDALRALRPELPELDILELETDPIVIILEVAAYRETLLRGLVNDKARAVMLALATGADLDHLGAAVLTPRLELTAATASAPAVMEADEPYRRRIHLALDAWSTAGAQGAYEYWALSSDPSVKDAAALNVAPGRVDVVLLGRAGDGTASDAAIVAVYEALSPKTRRPLTDDVRVRSATIVPQAMRVRLDIPRGPDPDVVEMRARANLAALASTIHAIGRVLRTDAIIVAARVGDVEKVTVLEPAADLDPGAFGAVHVSAIEIEVVQPGQAIPA
jgi:phage-related baseplate assembly protein